MSRKGDKAKLKPGRSIKEKRRAKREKRMQQQQVNFG